VPDEQPRQVTEGRPCKYCLAAYPILFEDGETADCEWTHRDEPRIYALATAMARVFQPRPVTDEKIGWFLQDADAVVDDFDPVPGKWRIRKLPDARYDDFVMRFRINEVTYVCRDGKDYVPPVRLSTLRQWQREADAAARERMERMLP
jgi:hypothetical protein